MPACNLRVHHTICTYGCSAAARCTAAPGEKRHHRAGGWISGVNPIGIAVAIADSGDKYPIIVDVKTAGEGHGGQNLDGRRRVGVAAQLQNGVQGAIFRNGIDRRGEGEMHGCGFAFRYPADAVRRRRAKPSGGHAIAGKRQVRGHAARAGSRGLDLF
jgi:hypothetical protein